MVPRGSRAPALALIAACLICMLASPAAAFERPSSDVGVVATDAPLKPNFERFARAFFVAKSQSIQGARRQIRLARIQVAIVLLALGLSVARIFANEPVSARRQRTQRVAWVVLGALAVASFFRFSIVDRSPDNMHTKDVYHYFIGSKYFSELGYGMLYDCSIAVAKADGRWWLPYIEHARDLKSMQIRPASEIAKRAEAECPGRFTEERWEEFQHDVRWFFGRIRGPVWRRVWLDHGYNPSPVWTAVAAPVVGFARADQLPWLVHIDSLLVALALAAIGWAFGLEAMGLAAVAWGTGWLWRYTWIGDALLRQIWFATAILGVCALRRGWSAGAGALLGVSALVRVFPAIFAAGYGLNAISRAVRDRSIPSDLVRFAAGGAGVAVLLVGASLLLSERGLADYRDFARNTEMIQGVASANEAGLKALLWRFDGTTDLAWRGEALAPWLRFSPSVANGIWIAASLAALALFWRAAREVAPWEAAALGFALIPILSGPSGYYSHFSILCVVLAARRPWIGVWLLLACLAWLVNGMIWRNLGEQFTVVSIVSLGLSTLVLVAMNRPLAGGCQPTRDRPSIERRSTVGQ